MNQINTRLLSCMICLCSSSSPGIFHACSLFIMSEVSTSSLITYKFSSYVDHNSHRIIQ